MTTFAACDPGLTGAVAFIRPNGIVYIDDLPTIELPDSPLVKRRIDGRAFKKLFLDRVPLSDAVCFVMEDVQAIGGSAVQIMGSMMRTVGTIESVVECLGLEVHRVRPQKWKSALGLTKEKGKALELARMLYPGLAETRIRLAKYHNRAEALLIAHWAKGEYS